MQVEVLVSRAAALGEAALSSSSAKKMAVRPLILAILKRMCIRLSPYVFPGSETLGGTQRYLSA